MLLLIVGLTFALIGAATAEWKVTLVPAGVAGLYVALGSLAPTPYSYDSALVTACFVAILTTAAGVFARRGVFGV